MTTLSGDTTAPPLTTATPLIEEWLVRDEQTNEVYFLLTSTVVLKRKQEMLYALLDSEKNYSNGIGPGGLKSVCQCHRPG